MRCKVCDYRLWNLKARQCPECGTAFAVSDYEFIPNSVQFCCPDCGQAYYGTGTKGHLVPEAFACVKCGRALHMNDMVLLPTEGIEEERTEPLRIPWLDRKRDGWWRSWWRTVGMSLVSPIQLIRHVPPEAGTGQAWRFAFATLAIVQGAGMLLILALLVVTGVISGRIGRGSGGVVMVAPLAVVAVWSALMLGGIAVSAAVAHVFLLVTGGTRYSFGRTCEALCYSAGANVLLLIPGCGVYVYGIWWLASASMMLKERQWVHGLRATLAVMMLPVLLVAGLTLTIWGLSRGTALTAAWPRPVPPTRSFPASGPATSSTNLAETRTNGIAIWLKMYAGNHGGRGPRHVVELVGRGLLPQDLLLPDTASAAADIPIGNLTLDQFGSGPSLPEGDRAAAVEAAIASLPPDVVAYRLGDFVLTYPGMDFQRLNRQLWTVIAWPDPDANPVAAPAEVMVGLLDGSTIRLYGSQMAMFLADQNALRVKNGLAPLPHPQSVRHGQPARVRAEQGP